MLAEGYTWDEVCARLDCSRGFVACWSRRFNQERLAGLYSRHRSQVASELTAGLEARILEAARKRPTDGMPWLFDCWVNKTLALIQPKHNI